MTVFLALTAPPAQVIDAQTLPAPTRIELESTSEQRVIFLEHEGPYWAAGKKFSEVREYMQLHREPGPVFMRYFRPVTNRKPGERSSLIGFFTKDATIAQAPFKARTIAPRYVARLIVEGHASSPQHLLKRMDRWVTDNDRATSSEVMEIYHLAPGDRGSIERTEFRLPLVVNPTHPPPSIPVQPRVTERRPDRIRTLPTAPIEKTQPPVPAIQIERFPEDTADSIPALVRAGRFDRVAELMLPQRDAMDPSDQVWIGKVFYRIKAAGKGLAQTNTNASSTTRLLAESLLKRYLTVFKDSAANPLLGGSPPSSPEDGPRAIEKRKLMRRLDSLLSRIAYGTAASETVETEVVDVLGRSRELLAK